jgi:hypothetical protein
VVAYLNIKPIDLLGTLRERASPRVCDAHPSNLDRASAGHHAFGLCVGESVADQLDDHFGGEAVRQQKRLGRAVRRCSEQCQCAGGSRHGLAGRRAARAKKDKPEAQSAAPLKTRDEKQASQTEGRCEEPTE